MDGHDIHPVDIVYVSHSHCIPGRLCVWLLLSSPFPPFPPSFPLSSATLEVHPRGVSEDPLRGVTMLKSVVSDGGKHKMCFLFCFLGS